MSKECISDSSQSKTSKDAGHEKSDGHASNALVSLADYAQSSALKHDQKPLQTERGCIVIPDLYTDSNKQLTGNLINSSAFTPEGDKKQKAEIGGEINFEGSGKDKTPDSMHLEFKHNISSGTDVVFSQPIDYQFKAVTDLQKDFEKNNPTIDLGHIVHIQFKAKADNNAKFAMELMDSKEPFKAHGFERVDLAHAQKDKDGYSKFDYYDVVPSTSNSKDIQFKINLGRNQQAGSLDFKGLSVEEVTSAPGLDPRVAIEQYRGDVAKRPDAGNFIFGAIGNKMIDANIRPTEAGEREKADNIEKKFSNMTRQEQVQELNNELSEYSKDHSLNDEQKKDYMQDLKKLGVNTLTVPVYWEQIEKSDGQLDYSKVDSVVKLAQDNGMKVKLHPIVWADLYPKWVDDGFKAAHGKDSSLTENQYTQNMIQKHVAEVIDHFGTKFGSTIGFVEMNEMNSTDQLMHQRKDDLGRVIRDSNNDAQTDRVHNGLTDWIDSTNAASVVNTIDGYIRQDLAKYPQLKDTKVLENEYRGDQFTQTFDQKISRDPNRPDAFGKEAHQFSADHLNSNENDPLLSIYKQINYGQVGGMKTNISELTVETTVGGDFDESKMSEALKKAEKADEQYRKGERLAPLSKKDRQAQERQAEELLAWYKLSVASKDNIGISLWDGSHKNAWLENTGGVLDSDNHKKVSYFALQEFISEFEEKNK